ncbi:MAG: hypothetical protein NVS4B8_26610 [Herpetosiphon sp.]
MNLETLVTLLLVGLVVATVVRAFIGWSLAGWLITVVLAILGGIAGWQLERRLNLPHIYSFAFPSTARPVAPVWLSVGAVGLALLGSLIGRPSARSIPRRRRYR